MIQLTTVLNVADNSGAKKIFCIQVLGGSRRKYGSIEQRNSEGTGCKSCHRPHEEGNSSSGRLLRAF